MNFRGKGQITKTCDNKQTIEGDAAHTGYNAQSEIQTVHLVGHMSRCHSTQVFTRNSGLFVVVVFLQSPLTELQYKSAVLYLFYVVFFTVAQNLTSSHI